MSDENKITDMVKADLAKGKKPTIINKFLKNFFFKSLKAKKEVKEVEKAIGELDTVTIIISKNKNILRASSGLKKEDIDFTNEEMQKFLKSINVKQSTIDLCKSIFVRLDFKTQIISIQQNLIDGTQKNFNL